MSWTTLSRLMTTVLVIFCGLAPSASVQNATGSEQPLPDMSGYSWFAQTPSELQEKVQQVFAVGEPNRIELEKAFGLCSAEEIEDLAVVVTVLRPLDVMDLDADGLVATVREARAARQFFPAASSDVTVYREGLLEPFITPYEHFVDWRQAVRLRCSELRAQDAVSTVTNVINWLYQHFAIKEVTTYFGPVQDPLTLITTGWGTEDQRDMLAVAMLRSLGVPARLSRAQPEAIEYYDSGAWNVFKMNRKNPVPNKDKGMAGGNPGTIHLELKLQGAPLKSAELFGFSLWREGRWMPLDERDYPVDIKETEKGYKVTIPPGEYLFTAGTRNANGDPYIHTKIVKVKSGSVQTIAMDIDAPPEQRHVPERLVRKLGALPAVSLLVQGKGRLLLDALVKESNMLLVFYNPNEEPSQRMLPLIRALSDELNAARVQSFLICYGAGRSLRPSSAFTELLDVDGALANAFKIEKGEDGALKNLPSILLLKKGGEPVLWVEGYDLAIDSVIKAALGGLK